MIPLISKHFLHKTTFKNSISPILIMTGSMIGFTQNMYNKKHNTEDIIVMFFTMLLVSMFVVKL